MKTIICILVVLTLVIAGPAAYGQVPHFFNPQDPSGNWSGSTFTWFASCSDGAENLGGPPLSTEDATICTSKVCTLDMDDEVKTISVLGTGGLLIPAGKTLTLNEHEGVSTIDGAIGLNGEIDISVGGSAANPHWHTFDGAGHIVGEDSGAKILINSNTASDPTQLFVSTTIRGMLEIGKLDPLKNDQMLVLKGGSIIADDHGTLKVNTGSMKDESGAARSLLEVSKYSDAVLNIDVGCQGTPPLSSFCAIFCLKYTDAEILEGRLDLDSAITTEGDLTMEPGGVFDVDASASASFRIDCGAP